MLAAKSLQLSPTLCDPIDGSPPGPTVPGILQTRTLEWVAISSSNAWQWKVKVKSLSRAQLLATPWTAAYQAPPSMGFSRQEYWSGVPLPSPSASVRSIQFLSFIVPIFAWNILLMSLISLKRSLVFPILLFSSIALHCSLRKAFLSLLAVLWNCAFQWIYLSFFPLPGSVA